MVNDKPIFITTAEAFPFTFDFEFTVSNHGRTNAFDCSYSWGFIEFTGQHDVILGFDEGGDTIAEGKIQPNRPAIFIGGFEFTFKTAKDYQKRIVIRLQAFDKFGDAFCADYAARIYREETKRYSARVSLVGANQRYATRVDTPEDAIRKANEKRDTEKLRKA